MGINTRKFKLALLQLNASTNKSRNIEAACEKIDEAAENGAKIISLFECFNCPYGTGYFVDYAEEIPGGETTEALAESARRNNVFVIGGSIPERDGDLIFNTCAVFNPEGDQIAKYRKVHLSNVVVPGKVSYAEADVFTSGNQLVSFDTPYCRVGLGICYDLRFEQVATAYAKHGCEFLVFPSWFPVTTGRPHMAALSRARALDSICYVACVSPARDSTSLPYVAWGHSHVTGPWADVIAQADETEQILYADVDLERVEEARANIPKLTSERPDVYSKPVHNASSDLSKNGFKSSRGDTH